MERKGFLRSFVRLVIIPDHGDSQTGEIEYALPHLPQGRRAEERTSRNNHSPSRLHEPPAHACNGIDRQILRDVKEGCKDTGLTCLCRARLEDGLLDCTGRCR